MRHGLTEMNVAGLWSGSSETDLTDEGRLQAKKAGQEAKALGIDTIVCSTQARAIETAEIVAKELGYALENIHKSSLLVERHMGALEGQPYRPDFDMDGIADIETTDTLFNRARLAIDWVHSLPGQTILIVSHGATGRAIRHILTPATPFHGSTRFGNAKIVKLMQK